MNKEFIGKKRFYSTKDLSINVVTRIYVIETRTDQFFSAVLEDGNSYQIEKGGPIEEINIQYFTDLNNIVFTEFPTKSFEDNVEFFDSKFNCIGHGDLLLLNLGGSIQYAFQLKVEKEFKYKQGWNYTVESGNFISGIMEPDFVDNGKLLSLHDSANSNKVLSNKQYQVYCKKLDYIFP